MIGEGRSEGSEGKTRVVFRVVLRVVVRVAVRVDWVVLDY